jgi:hypothetical protein
MDNLKISNQITIAGATAAAGDGTNEQLYVWLEVPESQASGTYNTVADWVISIINI